LRTLLVAVTLVCLLLTALPFEARQYQLQKNRARALITSLGGEIDTLTYSNRPSPGANLLSEFLGYVEPRESLWRVSLAGATVSTSDLKNLSDCGWICSLNLSNTNVGDDAMAHVAGMQNIVELRLANTNLTDTGVRQLSPMRSLLILDVAGTAVSYRALADLERVIPGANFQEQSAIARARAAGIIIDVDAPLQGLTWPFARRSSPKEVIASIELDLTRLGLHPDVAGAIHITEPMVLTKAHIEHLRRLTSAESFSASGVQFPPGGLEFLGDLKKVQSVTIDEGHTGNLTDTDLRVLAGMASLRQVVLFSPNITDGGIAHLAKATELTSLSIGGPRFTDDVFDSFSNAHQIESIAVHSRTLTPELLAPLSGLAGLQKLELKLWRSGSRRAVYGRPPDDVIKGARQSMQHLKKIPNLKELSLMGNLMVTNVLGPLTDLKSLQWVKVDGRYLSHDEARQLQLMLPHCHVQRIEFR
jgi:hypothetical protein